MKKNLSALLVFLLSTGIFFSACNPGVDKTKTSPNDSPAVNKPDTQKRGVVVDTGLVTIAAIDATKDNIEMIFYEREAIYSIPKSSDVYKANERVLAEAMKSNQPVKLTATNGAISNIIKASEAEIRAYNSGEGMNSPKMRLAGAPAVSIDVSKIDTAVFNRVEMQSRFPVFTFCNNVVPNYQKLVDIFNYCAGQGCNNPGPYAIPNCIPFQYVIDGCYARAHKMRQMISSQFGYCVEKVFSFSQPLPSRLAVKADKWGGCCVTWWYHVAPLLRLNIKFGKFTYQICYVIDPGMFNGPVTLSAWLQAQQNTTCYANAALTSYSIQPGSAYTPMNGGASFATDPNYVATEQTLSWYKNGVTCP